MLSLRIGDVWAQQIGNGHIGDVEVNHIWSSSGSGLNYVKWSMDLPPHYWHQSLAMGTKVEVFCGDVKLGSATMAEVDRANWKFVADGLFRRAEKFAPIGLPGDEGNQNLLETVTSANARGLGWNGLGNLPTRVIRVSGATTLAAMLTDYCESNSLRWGVDENDEPFVEADPYLYDPESIPMWAVVPTVPLMPFSDDIFATRVHVKFVGGTGTPGFPDTYDTVSSDITGDYTLPGGYEIEVIASPANIGVGDAKAIANTMMRRNSLRYGFTQGLDVFPGELTTPGGTPIEPWAAYTLLGKIGLHYGAINRLNWASVGETVQWVMGSVTYRPDDNSLRIASVDFQPRTLAGGFELLRKLSYNNGRTQ